MIKHGLSGETNSNGMSHADDGRKTKRNGLGNDSQRAVRKDVTELRKNKGKVGKTDKGKTIGKNNQNAVRRGVTVMSPVDADGVAWTGRERRFVWGDDVTRIWSMTGLFYNGTNWFVVHEREDGRHLVPVTSCRHVTFRTSELAYRLMRIADAMDGRDGTVPNTNDDDEDDVTIVTLPYDEGTYADVAHSLRGVAKKLVDIDLSDTEGTRVICEHLSEIADRVASDAASHDIRLVAKLVQARHDELAENE